MQQICAECGHECLCIKCDERKFAYEYNIPLVVKHLEKEMPIIISTCCHCHVELFRSVTYETKTLNKSFCLSCVMKLEDEAWKYRELNK